MIEGCGATSGDIRLPRPEGKAGAALGLLVLAATAAAQVPEASYHSLQLDCANYRQQVRSVIELEGSRQRSRETTGRDGILLVRASSQDSLVRLEAWFDTLTVWREGSGERLEPETDGVVGGRFKGTLSRFGMFTSIDRPFIPDEVAQVADVGDALAELLPPLPPVPLAPGRAWKDDFGTVISRLPDGASGGQPVQRYRLIRRLSREESRLLPDSTAVRAIRQESEAGVYEWSGELGPVRWEREITVNVDVPAGGAVRQAFRTRIVQQVIVERIGGGCGPK
jgi:hypothetical protein